MPWFECWRYEESAEHQAKIVEFDPFRDDDYWYPRDKVVVPPEICGLSVVSLGDELFAEGGVEEVVLPDSLVVIGDGAFRGCTTLGSINLPPRLEVIGDYAFDGCALDDVLRFPESVRYVGDYAFAGNVSLAGARIPNPACIVRDGAFEGCCGSFWDIFEVACPDGSCVQRCCEDEQIPWTDIHRGGSFGEVQRSGCWEYRIEQDGSVTTTEYDAWADKERCLEFPSTLCGRKVCGIGTGTFHECDVLTQVIVPEGVEWIEAFSFEGCLSLGSVVLPRSVTYICENAFIGCETLVITCPQASDAYYWCEEHGVACVTTG